MNNRYCYKIFTTERTKKSAVLAVRTNVPDGPEPLEHDAFDGFETKAAALSDDRISKLLCPVCKAEMNGVKWISQGDGRYMNIFTCTDHDNFLVRVRFKKNMENNTLFLSRLVYSCDDEMLFNYKEKASFVRRRGRGRRLRGTAKRSIPL